MWVAVEAILGSRVRFRLRPVPPSREAACRCVEDVDNATACSARGGTARCVISNRTQYSQKMSPAKLYLSVPYAERALAKRSGAMYDKTAKKWYVTSLSHMHCHKTIRRWHATSPRWRVFLRLRKEDTAQGAKFEHCGWDPVKCSWFVDVTGRDTLSAWHRDRVVSVERCEPVV